MEPRQQTGLASRLWGFGRASLIQRSQARAICPGAETPHLSLGKQTCCWPGLCRGNWSAFLGLTLVLTSSPCANPKSLELPPSFYFFTWFSWKKPASCQTLDARITCLWYCFNWCAGSRGSPLLARGSNRTRRPRTSKNQVRHTWRS